jgi:hypothetical protein
VLVKWLILLVFAPTVSCGAVASTWTQADVDGVIVCRLEKPAGQDVPLLTCRTVAADGSE